MLMEVAPRGRRQPAHRHDSRARADRVDDVVSIEGAAARDVTRLVAPPLRGGLGLTPKDHSTGGRQRHGGITRGRGLRAPIDADRRRDRAG